MSSEFFFTVFVWGTLALGIGIFPFTIYNKRSIPPRLFVAQCFLNSSLITMPIAQLAGDRWPVVGWLFLIVSVANLFPIFWFLRQHYREKRPPVVNRQSPPFRPVD